VLGKLESYLGRHGLPSCDNRSNGSHNSLCASFLSRYTRAPA
jgi:hypothetical protein